MQRNAQHCNAKGTASAVDTWNKKEIKIKEDEEEEEEEETGERERRQKVRLATEHWQSLSGAEGASLSEAS